MASNQHLEALSHTTAQGTSSHLLPHETYSKVIINQTRPYMIDHGLRGTLEWQKLGVSFGEGKGGGGGGGKGWWVAMLTWGGCALTAWVRPNRPPPPLVGLEACCCSSSSSGTSPACCSASAILQLGSACMDTHCNDHKKQHWHNN